LVSAGQRTLDLKHLSRVSNYSADLKNLSY
jgi:hypothetical protein